MLNSSQLKILADNIKSWAKEIGFAHVGICDTDLADEEPKLQEWLDKGYHGEMHYMANHGMMRARPHELQPGCLRVISVRMDYLPPEAGFATNLKDPNLGYISRYAGGRDYHKMMRNRIKKLGDRIASHLQELGEAMPEYRPFVDSAPILERPLADKAGIGWTGKHSLILSRNAGSWFFLGELLINVPLPVDEPVNNECGKCVACIKSCPTNAIVEPYVVDGRRCISYLTIEHQGSIPEEFRPLIGNRIYGCDDCQLVCPVNSEAPLTEEWDFHIRDAIKLPKLVDLFQWTDQEFLTRMQGSAIRRIGHSLWLRNIAIALGNAPFSEEIIQVLKLKRDAHDVSEMVREHIDWALEQQNIKRESELDINRKTLRVIKAVERGLQRDR
ncbi:tRNA epoxyqueuosine(34) reductase QueG [Parashewanella curva]|uniref:Epoxyqueuosine reductase n=1 Tax=Parashewanella curva TaxID=2338552 RepID=A0A3L8PZF2_9GAMM|nr:tRNA epoxyqueuosine(34) reductase QueG [Parashewanella curva]RLV60159.1 tRNA epoxyqueuosine(34) reductase QueG [Parashewanella curva]